MHYHKFPSTPALHPFVENQGMVAIESVVLDSGYHDQSHMVKEFQKFNQMNPRVYHQKHLELIRFVNQ